MKYIIALLLISYIQCTYAQLSGSIEYRVETKLDFKGETPGGLDLSGMLPESTTDYRILHFDQAQSAYVSSDKAEDEAAVMESDDGSFKMEFHMTSDKSFLHFDLKSKKMTEQKDFMGKTFLIKDDSEKINWKLTAEKIKYLDYVCHKAIAQGQMSDDGKPQEVIAWFAPQISASVGPGIYNGLPGAILMLSIDGEKTQMRATNIDFAKPDSKLLLAPTKGKKVTRDEYFQIVEERTKELFDGHSGNTFMIRG